MKTLLPLIAMMLFSATAFGQGTINVSGQAAIDVTPDKILISLGIETHDMDIQVAKRDNTTILQKAMAIFKELKIQPKHIQTDHLSINPRYRTDRENIEIFLGYWVTNNMVVTLTDVENVEPLITRVLEIGVNHLYGVDFQVTEFKKYRKQARMMAVKAAYEKADDMVGVLGMKVGKPTHINEGWSGMYSNHFRDSGRNNSHLMMQNVVSNQTQNGPSTDSAVAIGKVRIEASVSVNFQIVDSNTQLQIAE